MQKVIYMKNDNKLKISDFLEKTLLELSEIKDPLSTKSKKIKKKAEEVLLLSDEYVFSNSKNKIDDRVVSQLIKTYAIYFMPGNLIKLHPVLDELKRDKGCSLFKKKSLSLLDIGCGPGTFTIGFLEYLSKNGLPDSFALEKADLTCLDCSKENLSFAQKMIRRYLDFGPISKNIQWKTFFKKGTLTSSTALQQLFPAKNRFDVIIAGNVITELQDEEIKPFIDFLENQLAPDGTAIIIDPGTKVSSKHLLLLRDRILKDTRLNLYGPCPNAGKCPLTEKSKNWCHEKVFWTPPPVIHTIDRITGFSKEKGLKYSYLTFNKSQSILSGLFPELVSEKVFRVTSYLIKNKGEERLYVCNGKERLQLRRLNKNSSEKNTSFGNVVRGNLVFFDKLQIRKDFLDITKESSFKVL